MKDALGALRRLAAGTGQEGPVFRKSAALIDAVIAEENVVLEPEFVVTDGAAPESGSEHKEDEAGTSHADGEEIHELLTWGEAHNFQLGYGASGHEQPVPRMVTLSAKKEVCFISCGRIHSTAVTSCGSVFCWGFGGTSSRLGIEPADGSAPPSCLVEPVALPEFGPGRHAALKTSAGADHTLALTRAGKVLAWGSNVNGQLGLQGTPVGQDTNVRRPTIIKALKAEEVVDVAAGVAHSLCCTASGGVVFAWGSNACGALGLGLAPAGPAQVAQPQQLPHLRGVHVVAACPSGHVSCALASNGDAMIFGGVQSSSIGKGTGPSSRSAAANMTAVPVPDARFHTPSRVRRRERRGSEDNDNDGGEQWRTQRNSVGGVGSPLRAVTLGTEEAFAVDIDGDLWVWSLCAARPTTAEHVAGVCLKSICTSDGSGTLWGVDRSPAACLWRVRKKDGDWHAERYEQLAQVSSIACGPGHQAAVVTYRRPAVVREKRRSEGAMAGGFRMQEALIGHEYEDRLLHPSRYLDSSVDVHLNASQTRPAEKYHQPSSLFELCEDKLCALMSPQSFVLICDIAVDLYRPKLLDRAYKFLRSNTALLFCRKNLPYLSQLQFEALAAFELTAMGAISKPSMAFDIDPEEWGLPMEDNDDTEAATQAETEGMTSTGGKRRRRNVKGSPKVEGGGSPKVDSIAMSPTPSPKLSPLSMPSNSHAQPNGKGSTPGSVRAVPEWVTVKARKRAAGTDPTAAGSGPAVQKPTAQTSPKTGLNGRGAPPSPAAKSLATPKMQATSAPDSPPRPAPTQNVALADFIKPRLGMPKSKSASYAAAKGVSSEVAGETPSKTAVKLPIGPSAALSAAVESAHVQVQADSSKQTATPLTDSDSVQRKGSWATPSGTTQSPVSFLQILQEEDVNNNSVRSLKGPVTTDDSTHCSWGLEAMLTAQQKGTSILELQRQEEEEVRQQKVDSEIQEIEAMFAALEVAEREEAREVVGAKASSSSGVREGNADEAKRGRGRGQGGNRRGGHRKHAEHCGDDSKGHGKGESWEDGYRNKGGKSGKGGKGGKGGKDSRKTFKEAHDVNSKRSDNGTGSSKSTRWIPKEQHSSDAV